jgi:hypothetical protein
MPRSSTAPELANVVGRENARRLHDAGVGDLAWLLRIARTPEGRDQLAGHSGIPGAQLLEWAHLVDLCRLEGLDPSRASLLQKAGVRGLRELVASDARQLSLALRHLDSESAHDCRTVEAWMRGARKVRPAVHDWPPAPGEAWDGADWPIDGLEPLERPLPRRKARSP